MADLQPVLQAMLVVSKLRLMVASAALVMLIDQQENGNAYGKILNIMYVIKVDLAAVILIPEYMHLAWNFVIIDFN